MEIGTIFLAQKPMLRPGVNTVVVGTGGERMDVVIGKVAGDYLELEAAGVQFEARAWHEGDGAIPAGVGNREHMTAWTIYGVVGHTRPLA